jgi:hypothetical protein
VLLKWNDDVSSGVKVVARRAAKLICEVSFYKEKLQSSWANAYPHLYFHTIAITRN